MTNTTQYPMRLTPVLKQAIWGGRNLEMFGRTLPAGKIAESWEIAAHPNGSSIVINGTHAGKSLAELTLELGTKLVGTNGEWAVERGKFPLLVKLIDANDRLSVQVHPKDDYARLNEGNELGKTEMWVLLKAKENAQLIYGVKKGATPQSFRQAVENGMVESQLQFVSIKTGDHVSVPAGTVHAIMEGEIIAEIQQNSDTTYRVYDWNRTGADGKPRELHIDKALDVIDFEHPDPKLEPAAWIESNENFHRYRLCANEYFITERIELQAGASYNGKCDGSSLEIWGIIQGSVHLNTEEVSAIEFVLLPAQMGAYIITSDEGAVLLRTYLPEK